MNLKESFRYQTFLQNLLTEATGDIIQKGHCLKVTETHLKNKANSDAQDEVKVAEVEDFYPNDNVLELIKQLIKEKTELTKAINKAKQSTEYDLDACVESNKFRHSTINAIKHMLACKPSKKTIKGTDYKFNAEGNQSSYIYDIEVVSEDTYDRAAAQKLVDNLCTEADNISCIIDKILVDTEVDYIPTFNVNDTFENIMEKHYK